MATAEESSKSYGRAGLKKNFNFSDQKVGLKFYPQENKNLKQRGVKENGLLKVGGNFKDRSFSVKIKLET